MDLDTRTERAHREAQANPNKIFGWCSVSCVCDGCLNADALLFFWATPRNTIDMKGLS